MKKISTLIIIICLSLLLMQSVTAIGISPPIYKLTYSPSHEETFGFTVSNNAGKDIVTETSVSGSLAKYVTLSNANTPIKKDASSLITATLTLPETIEEAGLHRIRISVKEGSLEQGGVTARAGVVAFIDVFVPYPGTYAEINSFTIANGNKGIGQGEELPITFTINNRGEDTLIETAAHIQVIDYQNEVVAQTKINNITILPDTTYTGSASLDTSTLPPHDYKTMLTFTYADKETTNEKVFAIGDFVISLDDYAGTLEQKGIVPLDIALHNKWQGEVFASTQVTLEEVTSSSSARKKINGFDTATFTTFIDTQDLTAGEHPATLIVTAEKTTGEEEPTTFTYPLTITIVESASVTEEPQSFKLSSTLLFSILALILLLGINAYVLFRVTHKQKK